MKRFAELLRAANSLKLLAAIGRSGGELSTIADLVDHMLDSPQMADCVRRFRQVEGGAALMDQRYPPLVPDLDRLIELPQGSLGHTYASLIRRLNYDPDFFRPRPIATEAQWLTQRIATTHDIHHVVSGFAPTPEGENGVLAITTTQIGFPAYVMLNNAAQVSRFRLKPDSFALLSRAIAHGTTMGFSAKPLWLARWEEGWDWPVAQWRQELGISAPADHQPYGLQPVAN